MTIGERMERPDAEFWSTVQGEVSGTIKREMHHFANCRCTRAMPVVICEDGMTALRIVPAVEEAARTGWAVRMGAVDARARSRW